MLVQRTSWVKALSKKAKKRTEESDEIHKKVKKKRKQNRAKAVANKDGGKGDHPNFVGAMTLDEAVSQQGARQTQKDVVNWYIVQGWFWKEITRINKKWLVVKTRGTERNQTWWVWEEKNCAHRLLKHYGPDVVRSTVKWFVENWQALKDRSDGVLTGAPTVQLLWASRERYFPDAQAGVKVRPPKKRKAKKRKGHEIGEYNDESASKLPRVGWGDV